jgi:hypothetical protein
MTSDGRAGCTHDRRGYALILPATFRQRAPRRGNGDGRNGRGAMPA